MNDAMTDLFAVIESAQFASRLSPASSVRVFLNAVWDQDEVNQLHRISAIGSAGKLDTRLLQLLSERSDPAFRHPHDVAIAAYLAIALRIDPDIAASRARQIFADFGDSTFWARLVAQRIIATNSSNSSSLTFCGATGTREVFGRDDAVLNNRRLLDGFPEHRITSLLGEVA